MIKNNKGFTLIELIATIAIMLIIISIAIPTSIKFIDRGNEQEYNLIIDKIKVAAQEYYKNKNMTSNIINISDLVDYIDIDDKYIINNKIKDPRGNDKCLTGYVVINFTKDTVSIESYDKIEINTSNISSQNCY